MAIDIGSSAEDRPSIISGGQTYIIKDNPANASGRITQIQVYVNVAITTVTFFTCYNTGVPDTFTVRDYQSFSQSINPGYNELTVDIDVETGDYLGWIADASARIDIDLTVGVGYWRNPDNPGIPFTNTLFTDDTEDLTRTMSVYGIGTENVAPTVTTQDITSPTQTTATGNGNITDLGSPNPTAHGVCWNTTGTPTTADSKTDEGAASATGAFTTSMTGLSAGTHYYVRAYATNTAGTSYGNQVEFDSTPVILNAGLPMVFSQMMGI